jgi:hypothetical protein
MSLYQFYRSDNWENLLAVLKNERVDTKGRIICAHCGRPIVKKYDCIGHHKIPLTEENYRDATISLNPDNIDLVHHKCHNMIHNKLHCPRQVFIVYGSPLSGKSTYVNEVLNQGDLVMDMDSIWQCVSGFDRYVKPKRLNAVVFSVRDNILDSVKYRRGKWKNAYIIGGYPLKGERERLMDTLGAREILIDSSKEECLLRLKENNDRDEKEWTGYIESWWSKYQGTY